MNAPRPLDRVSHGGKTVDRLTQLALLLAEERLGYTLTVVQGCYNTGVGTSAGTHDRGGVVDLAPADYERKVITLRRIGFAAYYRPELYRGGVRLWPAHIHAVMVGHPDLSPAAARQVDAYLAGRNALADNGPDPHTRAYVKARFRWSTGAGHTIAAARLLARARHRLRQARGVPGLPAARAAVAAAQRDVGRLTP